MNTKKNYGVFDKNCSLFFYVMLNVLQYIKSCEGHTALHNIFKQLLFLTETISELVKEVVMVIALYDN
jgi:hypothetical protein